MSQTCPASSIGDAFTRPAGNTDRVATSFRRTLLIVIGLRCAVGVVLAGWELATPTPAMTDVGYYQQMTPDTSLWGQLFLKWDSYWYLHIAEHGYRAPLSEHGQSPTAFAPLYPYLMRIPAALGITPDIGGVLLSMACFLLATWFIYRIGVTLVDERVGCAAALLWALFPSSWVLNMVYTEALFCLVLAALMAWYLERRYTAAAVCAMLLPLVRTAGVVLVPVLLADLVWRSWRERRVAEGGIVLLGAGAGVAGLFIFFAIAAGDATAFLGAGQAWFERAGVAGQTLPLLHSIPPRLADDAFAPVFIGALALYGGAAVVLLWRRRDLFGWFGVAYMAMLLQTPILNAQMRYLLPMIPVHLMLAAVLARRPLALRATCLMLLLLQIVITRGYLVWTLII